jgi:hypothetical protein
MKPNACLLLLLLASSTCPAQSLVPNGDFEQYTACPSYWGQLDSALFWTNPTTGTPDYFNACTTFNNTGVPGTGMGQRTAHSGMAYGGIALWDASGTDKREYMETALTTPLIANAQYHFEMYASIGFYAQYTTDAIQIYFSDTLIANVDTNTVLPFVPQLSNAPGAFISVSEAPWTLISGDYTAHGGESYLLIGNFSDDASTTLQPSGAVFNAAYSYIDDVSLTLTTSTEVQMEQGVPEFRTYPNPAGNSLTVELPAHTAKAAIKVYNMTGGVVHAATATSPRTVLDVARLAKGAYLLEVDTGTTTRRQKLMKE